MEQKENLIVDGYEFKPFISINGTYPNVKYALYNTHGQLIKTDIEDYELDTYANTLKSLREKGLRFLMEE